MTDANNVVGRGDRIAGEFAHSDITVAGSVVEERAIADGRVPGALSIMGECANTVSRVVEARGVVEERAITDSHVLYSLSVGIERAGANGRVFASGVQEECPGADTGVEVAFSSALERKPANCCVRNAGGEAKKGALPFCRVEPGIAAAWRGNNPESIRGSLRTEKRECEANSCEYVVSIFHKLNTDAEGHVFQRIKRIFGDANFDATCSGTRHEPGDSIFEPATGVLVAR